MRLDNVTKVTGVTRRSMNFATGACFPGAKPFEVMRDKELWQMSPASPRDYLYLKIVRDGETEYWGSDKNVWKKFDSLKAARAFCKFDQAVREYKESQAVAEQQKTDLDTRLAVEQIKRMSHLSDAEKADMIQRITKPASRRTPIPGVDDQAPPAGDGTQDHGDDDGEGDDDGDGE